MAFADTLDLRTAVVEAVGDASIAEVFDRLVLLAESKLNRTLRTRQQITRAPVVVVDQVAALPVDFAQLSGLYHRGYEVLGTNLQRGARGMYAVDTAIRGPNGIYEIEYYAKLPTLTVSLAGSNWLLQTYPDVYLYAVAVEAVRHLRDPEQALMFQAALEDALASVRADDASARYATARIRVKGPTP